MNPVTSPHNEAYKNLKRLATSAKHRRQTGQTILEGIHLCQSYLQHVGRPLACIYTDVAASNAEVASIIDKCQQSGVRTMLLGEANFNKISSLDNGVGIAFLIEIPKMKQPGALADGALLLDGVQDPGNMGTIIRTAAAAGLSDIFISNDSSSAWSPRSLRAGMGAHFVMNIYEGSDLSRLIADSQMQILATSLEASSSVYDVDLARPTAWLFGSEGGGVSDELMSLGVAQVIIPQNHKVESLNVAASVAVCLFEQQRQRILR